MIKGLRLLLAIQLFLFTGVFANTEATTDSTETVTAVNFNFTPDIFQNVSSKGGEESAKITWSINHEAYTALKAVDAKLIITYNTKIGKKRNKKGVKGGEWMYTEAFDIDKTSFKITDLIGHESYYFKLGVSPNGNIENVKTEKGKVIWSSETKTKTKRTWGIAKLLILIGALGFFIFGMKLMSEGLQQAAGNKLRSMLGSITSNRLKGVLTGFGITSIVQSSSVTSVMTVSFVNAGLMTLRQSAGVMMGANVGTTITAWLVLLLGFKVSVSSYAFMIIALATPLLFMSKGKARAWASAIFGFCILFIGLDVLKDTVPMLNQDSSIVQFFIDFKDVWYGRLMFVLLGTLVTVVIQSSSAAMALTLTMVAAGSIPFEVACAMILGENIGTTITAQIASLIANVHAKRSAYIHTMFNLIGVVWMILIFPWFVDMIGYFIGGSAFDPTNTEMANSGIALFHTLFNVANVLVLIWFVPQLVSLAERLVKSKGESDEEFKLDFIDGPLGSTAELCILEASKEVAKFGKITAKMNGFVKTYINTSEKKVKNKMLDKLEKYEEITDRVEVEIADYLGETARLEMSDEASTQMRGMLNISTDLERIGDIFFQMSKALEKKDRDKHYFTPEQREGINDMIAITEEAFTIMNDNLTSTYGAISLDKAIAKEKEINALRDKLRRHHLTTIENSAEFNINSALVYSNIFSSFEKVGDHIINVSEAIAGEI
ncbi:MAG: Na/Pi cotransporter family protein [Crocinitomicaceae bacterium]|nr:Na/Pi cotransporter family protein [Crocinitomicaceae bacterium]MDG1776105.1 Na/Pi cotransporter family protein [Crocinitomicaceae bacterium]